MDMSKIARAVVTGMQFKEPWHDKPIIPRSRKGEDVSGTNIRAEEVPTDTVGAKKWEKLKDVTRT